MATNVFFLEAKCVKTNRTFYPRYDLAADDLWCLTYGVKELPAGQRASGSGGPGVNMSGTRTGPQYCCPWCGNESYVRCGRCHALTCYNPDSELFKCAYCGNSGKVTGVISDDDLKKSITSSGSGQ